MLPPPHLIIENDENNIPITFMEIKQNKLEMLFVCSKHRGMGIGKKMIIYGIEHYKINKLAVNEENLQAK